ncbi:DEAD/DEAH box helicase [Prauserella aidingensis]|uniref:DEAD/DEAH box helicase n=1 Tax=Prauserella aidingensis TaxID=387890 RepID=UPI0020A3EBA9|nr:DEAD/DEAH box helicase [Prauserella aidingensis]
MREAISIIQDQNQTAGADSAGGPATDVAPDVSRPAAEADTPAFAEFGLKPEIISALAASGKHHTFAIQALTLPLALKGDDVIGQARTGMGKTLGFGVPLLQRLETPGDGTPQALVVVPTRELCVQVTKDLAEAGANLGITVESIYGGRPYEPQIEALQRGVDIVVGTPGRLLDLAEQRHLVLGKVRSLVLDEADEMLDLGFLPDIERILRMVPEERQTMLFSATMPGPIINLARTFLTQPTHIRAEENDAGAIHERTTQFVYRAHSLDKPELVAKVLQAGGRGLTMIFTRTKRTAQKVADELTDRGFAAAAVHGDLGQGAREQALRAFRSSKVDVLVATDVAARGIDVDDVTHVINYQMPEDEKTYVHRIGRTGRAGKTGVAVTLVDWDEIPRWKLISDELGLDQPEPVETYSTSKHLFSDLDIPADATGRLPLGKRTREGLSAEDAEDLGDKRRERGGSRDGGSRDGGAARSRNRKPRKRTRGGRSEDGGPAESTGAESPSDGETAQTGSSGSGRSRSRRRTRGGGSGSKPATESHASADGATGGGDGQADGGQRPARRRRRRGGRGRGGSGSEASQDTTSQTTNTGETSAAAD